MRSLLLVLLTLAALSGCLDAGDDGEDPDADGCDATCEADLGTDPTDPDSDDDGVPDGSDQVAAPREVPAPIVFEGSLRGVGSPVGDPAPGTVPQCPLMAQQCAEHTVTVPAGTWTVTFTLVGTNGMVTDTGVPNPTDYDLFVDGVGESTNPGGETDVVAAGLAPGDYVAQVLAWHDIDGSYTLTVTFA